MRIISTNIGNATTFTWKGKEEQTGIFKYPTSQPIHMGKTDVTHDTVIDRKHHAGINKACYLFASDHYPYWKKQYPHLEWNWGMFGENLTVEGLNEATIRIGDIYKIGTAWLQVSQPREPCYKLGIRFGDQKMVGQFVNYGHSGTYVRIVKEGMVKTGDSVELLEASKNPLTVKQFYQLLYAKEKDPEIVQLALTNPSLPEYKRAWLRKVTTPWGQPR